MTGRTEDPRPREVRPVTAPREQVCKHCTRTYVNTGTYRGNRGYCPTCYSRWYAHGRPAGGPPPPQRPGRRPGTPSRLEDFAELASWGLTHAAAAQRLGVSIRTIERYATALSRPKEALAA
jgi:hypothetical protein